MIRPHAFNSLWWGQPVGVLDGPALLEATPAARADACAPYAWAEFSANDTTPALRLQAHAAGFVHADTYVQFRIDLRRHVDTALPGGVTVRAPGNGQPGWRPQGLQPFEFERFVLLRGCSGDRLLQRYAIWAGELTAQHPETCLEFVVGDQVAGWFLGRPSATGLELTLAMAAQATPLAGARLYQLALGEFARRGYRLGHAGFSIRNRSVHNIYAALGARFTGLRDSWLWQPDEFQT